MGTGVQYVIAIAFYAGYQFFGCQVIPKLSKRFTRSTINVTFTSHDFFHLTNQTHPGKASSRALRSDDMLSLLFRWVATH